MGFKSQNKQSNNTTYSNNTFYKIGGLIFESVDDYLTFKNLDKNINETIKSVNDGLIDINNVFDNIKKINVKEVYPEASEELDGLFENATTLLCYDDERFDISYKVARSFFRKIKVIDYL